MTDEKTWQPADLHAETRRIWDQKAAFWDEKMGDGNQFQRILIGPACERLLELQPGEVVLEIGCGNGVFARRMAGLGVQVVATDFSARFLERARARRSEQAGRIEYRLLDATHEDEILALGARRFDAAVCNMALMDMSEIEPLMRGIRQVVRPGGRFVFSLSHPCFNHAGATLCTEEATSNGALVITRAIKTTSYLHFGPQRGVGMPGEPVPHYYFDRPLHVLCQACFQAGLLLDGLEEPAFAAPLSGSRPGNFWMDAYEIPPVLVARWRIPNEDARAPVGGE
ncbi:MAG TPA: methyltransferase domain-containing protein [Ktedonobacteraceae bacterium]|jgi:SAM-dependent methyltransferase